MQSQPKELSSKRSWAEFFCYCCCCCLPRVSRVSVADSEVSATGAVNSKRPPKTPPTTPLMAPSNDALLPAVSELSLIVLDPLFEQLQPYSMDQTIIRDNKVYHQEGDEQVEDEPVETLLPPGSYRMHN